MRVVYHRRYQNLKFRLYHITYYYIIISNLDKECNMISYIMVIQVTKYDGDIILIIEQLYILQSQLYNYVIQKKMSKILKQMMLHSMATTYQLHKKHMYFKVSQLQCVYKLQSVVYKIDQFVLGTLSSSLMLLNTRVIFYSIT